MNEKIKKLWVTELRSGDFEQGKAALRDGQQCCCLGVLCELAWEAGVPVQIERPGADLYSYDGLMSFLPHSVRRWAGLTNSNPAVVDPEGTRTELSYLNDEGVTFKRIADLIERSDVQ